MKIFIVIAASLTLISGIVYSRVQKIAGFGEEEKAVLSADTQDGVTPEGLAGGDVEKDAADKNVSSFTQEATVTPVPTQTHTFTEKPVMNNTMDKYIYPGSEIVSSSSDSLFLRSSDDTNNITNWYKEKFFSEKINDTSSITEKPTKPSEKILNKLVSADGDTEISVEIKKEESSSYSEITVTYTNK